MKIFITWSGPRSLAVAEALDKYLPLVVNAFKPWLSKRIDKGANWRTELAAGLAGAKAGIICLTPSNLEEPWLLYEAGAIANAVPEKPLACTLLIGLKSSDVTGPLSQFQDTKLTRDDLLQMTQNLNTAAEAEGIKEAQVEAAFDLVWPKLKQRLDNLPKDEAQGRPHRTDRELLEELVENARSASAQTANTLNLAVEGIAAVSDRLRSLEASVNSLGGGYGFGGYGGAGYGNRSTSLGRPFSVSRGPTLSMRDLLGTEQKVPTGAVAIATPSAASIAKPSDTPQDLRPLEPPQPPKRRVRVIRRRRINPPDSKPTT